MRAIIGLRRDGVETDRVSVVGGGPEGPLCRRSEAGFRCGVREGPLSSLHRKKLGELRSMIMVHSFPSHDGKRRSGLF